jgi:hypothetical protein
MEEPGIINLKRRRVQYINVFALSFLFYFYTACNSNTNTMETRGTVKGILTDSSGKPVNDAVVMIVDGSSEFNDIASVSNDKGEFYLSNIALPGRYVLQIQDNSHKVNKEVNLQSKDSVIRVSF